MACTAAYAVHLQPLDSITFARSLRGTSVDAWDSIYVLARSVALTTAGCRLRSVLDVAPGDLSEPRIQHPSHFVGLLLRGAGLPWPNYGHVVLAKPSPILFYPISSTEVSSW